LNGNNYELNPGKVTLISKSKIRELSESDYPVSSRDNQMQIRCTACCLHRLLNECQLPPALQDGLSMPLLSNRCSTSSSVRARQVKEQGQRSPCNLSTSPAGKGSHLLPLISLPLAFFGL